MVAEVVAGGTLGPGDPDTTLELDDFLLLTAPADPHAHLDKALSWDAIRPPMGDLSLAIESWHAYSDQMTVDEIAVVPCASIVSAWARARSAISSTVIWSE